VSQPTVDLIEVVVDVAAGEPDVVIDISGDSLLLETVPEAVDVLVEEAGPVTVTVAQETISLEMASGVQVSLDGAVYLSYVHQVDAVTAYAGDSVPGTATSVAAWRIKKIEELAGGVTRVTWASSSTGFQHVWDDRATYTYG